MENKNISSQYPSQEETKSKANQIEVPSISLPKGGGAIKSIDEKFQVNAANGTAGFSVPFPFSKSRNDFMPGMALSYNSGSGNGVFGMGWNAEPPSITRKTEKKLPEYNDAEDSDTFIFSGAEDLVPALKKGTWLKDENINEGIKITRYKPRIEGGFARIEKITESGNVYWKVTSKDNIVSVFGKSKSAQISNPDNETKIFKWLLEFSYDDKGNCFQLEYKKEDKAKVPDSLSEKNRLNDYSRFTNTYLKRIKYCSKESYLTNKNPDYFLELVLDYGEHDEKNPQPGDRGEWKCRKDPFSDYRAGFEIRTYRSCKRLLMFHHFTELGDSPCLVRSMDFKYESGTAFTFLKLITQKAFIRKAEGTYNEKIRPYNEKALPPIEFTYEQIKWNTTVNSLPKESLENLPIGLDDKLYQWIDLYGEGISGILTEQANTWYYKKNSGEGTFESAKVVSPKPSLNGVNTGAVHFQDIEANGQKFLVSNDLNGYFEFSPEDEWIPFKNFNDVPNVDVHDPNVKFLDLNGDGKADMLISEDDVFVWYASKGKEGFGSYRTTRKNFDEEKGPNIVFADSTQSIVIADMSGDGLMDIVRIRNTDIVYWPNLGYGRFGAKVNMSYAPLFDNPEHFNAKYIKLADIDGSGTTDIVYLANDSFKIYFNQSGNSWSEENIVQGKNPLPFPKIDDHVNINIVDLFGSGTGCIVWSSPLPQHAGNPLRYIDLMCEEKQELVNGIETKIIKRNKPHIMASYKNNMGKEVCIEYKSSALYYLDDKKAGTPWITKLPFPIQCVSKVVVKDKWRQTQFSNRYCYHHGYYDYGEREFRGFGRVDQVDAETFGEFLAGNIASPYITDDKLLHQPPVMTKTWFHTGAFLDKEKILSQFAHEYFAPASLSFSEHTLPEPDLNLFDFTIAEYKEALRSCKGMMLRQEVYELDVDEFNRGNYKPVKLFSTAFHNCNIQLLQPKKDNSHAVFLTTESETITYNYELNLRSTGLLPDPRVVHTLNLSIDELGNVLESLAVVYPRIGRHADTTLPAGAEDLIANVQQEQHIIYTVNNFTNDEITLHNYRLRMPCEVKTFEITGLQAVNRLYFSLEEIKAAAPANFDEIAYHLLPDQSRIQKRLVENVCILYFQTDLIHAKPKGQINHLGLPYETYKLALTKELLSDVLGEKLPGLQQHGESYDAMLVRVLETKGGYHLMHDKWWIRSGIAGFASDAAEHFYLPEKYTDPFENVTNLQFDLKYDFYIQSSDDAAGNHTEVMNFDFRVLAPLEVKDINDNLTEVVFDIIGMPAAMAVKGKGSEGDNLDGVITEIDKDALINFFTNEAYEESQAQSFLGNATARYVYYLGEQVSKDGATTYENHPACAAAIIREKHVAQLAATEVSPVQIAFQYSDGSGTVLCSKVQSEPESLPGIENTNLRWITNGKTILNNKGRPVKKYEPYFTDNHLYAEPVEVGVTPIMYYDSAGRLIRTEMPDGSYSRVEFTPWFGKSYDQNDTVKEPGNQWYQDNFYSDDPAKNTAAEQASVHANTPAQTFFDSLGREVIAVSQNKWQTFEVFEHPTDHEEKYLTYTKLDAEGKPLWIQDPRGNRVMQYIFPFKPDDIAESAWSENYSPCYDIGGNLLFQHSMDGGNRWMIIDAAGRPYYSWDENERQDEENNFQLEKRMYVAKYDELHRPTETWLYINETPEVLIEKIIYGEETENDKGYNLRGQAYKHFDAGEMVLNKQFDFKGNLLDTQKQIAAAYKAPVIDWQEGSITNSLEPEIFSQQTEYDALNRMTRLYNWHKDDRSVAVYEPKYSKRGLLEGEDIIVRASKIVDPDHEGRTIYSGGQRTAAVRAITYDAKGQLQKIYYGDNGKGTLTRYYYDENTFRLLQLRTTRKVFDPEFPNKEGLKDPQILQNLYYTYDAVGNITKIYDDAYEPAFFNNQVVKPQNTYTYDSLYRLISATGRENSTFDNAPQQRENAATSWESIPVSDSSALRDYTQLYAYDAAGNIRQMKHIAGQGPQTMRWTRNYIYDNKNNRLLQTQTGSDETDYQYDTHGSMRNLANVDPAAYVRWDYRDMVQSLNCLGGGWAHYQYDSGKQRNRKLIERSEGIIEERWYHGGMEWYRRINATGEVIEEIETHHLFVGNQRVLIVEDVISTNSDLSTGILYRYQYSNHLGSVGLEADEGGNIISYEEYHPYGTPAYRSINKDVKCTAKPYRYTGMERDEESGLNYHRARYYIPWLGRWHSCDPIGIRDELCIYKYAKNNPVNILDRNGLQSGPFGFVQLWHQAERAASDISYTAEQAVGRLIEPVVEFFMHAAPAGSHGTEGQMTDYERREMATYSDRVNQAWTGHIYDYATLGAGPLLSGGSLARRAIVGSAVSTARRGVNDIVGGEMSSLTEYAVDATTGLVIGAVCIQPGKNAATAERTVQIASESEVPRAASSPSRSVGQRIIDRIHRTTSRVSRDAQDARDLMRRGLSGRERGPAVAVARASEGISVTANEAPSRPLHAILDARRRQYIELHEGQAASAYHEIPGLEHAEINAVNERLHAIEDSQARSATEADLSEIIVEVRSLSARRGAMPMCARCSFMTEGVQMTEAQTAAQSQQASELMEGTYPMSRY